ncbi:hypothetical protein Tco_1458966 [Tanacetum coccineum]
MEKLSSLLARLDIDSSRPPLYYELVRKIKEQVQNLPDLEIPLENAYIILETDGCMEGWGGIVKWKKSKEDPKKGHFAKDCRSKQGNIARSAVYQEMDLDDNWDIVLADFDDSSVYSISEGEGDTHQSISVMVQDTPVEETIFIAIEEDYEIDSEEEDNQSSHYAFMFHPRPPTKIAEMVQAVGSWKPNKELPAKSKECEHEWKENTVTKYTICYYCRILTTDISRLNCPKCQLTTCALCARNYLGKTVNVKRKQPQKSEEERDFSNNEVKLLKELLKEKTKQVQQMIRDQAKEYYENKAAMQKKEE